MNRKNSGKRGFPLTVLMLLLVCDFCYGQSVSKVWIDEKRGEVCLSEGNKQTRHCFNVQIFEAYDRLSSAKLLQNDVFLINHSLPGKPHYIETKWKFDKVYPKLTLKDVTAVSYNRTGYDGEISICTITEINQFLGAIDGDKLFNRLIDDKTICRYEYNGLSSLQEFYERISKESRDDKYFLANYGKDVERYKAYLKAYPLSDENVTIYNNIGYYLEQAECYDEAVFLLDAVIKKYPQRVVAYLNIADAYRGNNKKPEAKKMYETYINLMKSQGKDMSKIPQRAYDAVGESRK